MQEGKGKLDASPCHEPLTSLSDRVLEEIATWLVIIFCPDVVDNELS